MLAEDKLNNIKVLISKNLINVHDEFLSVTNMLKEYDDMKEAIKNPQTFNSNNKYSGSNQKISVSEKELTDTCGRLKKHWVA